MTRLRDLDAEWFAAWREDRGPSDPMLLMLDLLEHAVTALRGIPLEHTAYGPCECRPCSIARRALDTEIGGDGG